jgi:hypothetical protein
MAYLDQRLLPQSAVKTARVLLTAALVALPLLPATAAAPTEEELIKQGIERRRTQDDAGALELFIKAYQLNHSARAAAQMGLAETALGRWTDAEQHLDQALAAPDAWTRKNRTTLDGVRGNVAKQLGNLQVLGNPAGAEIVIEGEVRGALPMAKPVRVRIGECRIDVRAKGYAPVSRVVRIAPGELTRETVRLSELRVAEAAAPAARPREAISAPPLVPLRREAAPAAPSAERAGLGLRVAGMILAGTGALVAGGGLAFGLAAKSAGETDSQAAVFMNREATGRRYQTLQWVGYGVGAALIAAGATTYLLGRSRREDDGGTSVSLLPIAGGAEQGVLATVGGRL